jgi:putative ABC transport system permease protein
LVVVEGIRIALAGAVVGAVGALAAGRLVSSMLFEVSARDAFVLSAVAIGMVCVAIVACLVPARRATRVDLAQVLRGD